MVASGQRYAHTCRLRAQLLERYAARRQLMAERRVDVAVPEVLTEPESRGEGEDDGEIRARLAPESHERCSELDQRLGLLADLEADPQGLRCLWSWIP